ncbi:MAG TPA: diaminopimelate epimerase [Jatrophihabitans sp.]|nr:diaminopimelate epimerase [Jatrophihabitans sp.]
MNRTLTVMKGHGTENDFVVLPDLEAVVSLSPSMVRALCDRRAGIGADGVLRVTRTALATEPDVHAQAGVAEYFMDYHNADGSIAEMCGNGLRVFGRYLQRAGLADAGSGVTVATRGGPKALSFDGELIVAELGPASVRSERPRVSVDGLAGEFDSVALDLPNPHVVVQLDSAEDLAAVRLTEPPRVRPGLPEGQNVEFVVRLGPDRLRMRVYERGSGETRSCGTGICAAVAAVAGPSAGPGEWVVETPGGECRVWWNAGGAMMLAGPAVLIASVELSAEWLAAHR